MRKRWLDRARGALDRCEEADLVRDLDPHRFQHVGGVRPAHLTAHALKIIPSNGGFADRPDPGVYKPRGV
jgi:hypothetical protein